MSSCKEKTAAKKPAVKATKKEPEYKIGTFHSIPLSKIENTPNLLRLGSFETRFLTALEKSMKDQGYQPLDVYVKEGRFYVSDGFTRCDAARLGKWKNINVIIIPKEKAHSNALDKAMMRNQLTALERAVNFKRYMDDHGVKATELAEKYQKSDTNISQTLSVLRLPEEMQKAIGGLPFTLRELLELVGLENNPEEQQARFEEIFAKRTAKPSESSEPSEDDSDEDDSDGRRSKEDNADSGSTATTGESVEEKEPKRRDSFKTLVDRFADVNDRITNIFDLSKGKDKKKPTEEQQSELLFEFVSIGANLNQHLELPVSEVFTDFLVELENYFKSIKKRTNL